MRPSIALFKAKSFLTGRFGLMLTGNFLTIIINILMVKILTNKLSTEDFGSYSLIVAFSTLPQLVLFAPISSAIFPQLQKSKDPEDYIGLQKDVFDIFLLVLFAIIAFFFIVFLLSFVLPSISKELLFTGVISALFSTSLSLLGTFDSFSLATHHIREYIALPLFNLFIKLLVICVLFSVSISPIVLISIFILIHLLLANFEYKLLRRRKIITYRFKIKIVEIFKIDTPRKSEILKYASNFFIWGIFGWLQSFFDKWILDLFIDKKAVAIYTVYFQYGFFPFTVLSSVISQYITPIYFQKTEVEDKKLFMKTLFKNCTLSLIASLIIAGSLSYFLGGYAISLLTNSEYLKYIDLFPIIVVAGCFYGVGQIITVPLLDADLVKKVRFPKIFTALLSVILFWILIPRIGFSGILISLVISNLFYYLFLSYISSRSFK